MESGIRAAMTQLENRQRRFGLRRLRLPQRPSEGDSGCVHRYWTTAHECPGLRGKNREYSPAEPETIGTGLLPEGEAEAVKARPGLTVIAGGPRVDDGIAGYAVVWKDGQSWVDIKTHMGYNQEAYDAECGALARLLESASRRNVILERVTILTDGQAAIRQTESHEPGTGQHYALEARKHIAVVRKARPGHRHRNSMVLGTQDNRRQRENRRVDDDCSGGPRHPWSGMVELLGPGRGARGDSPKVYRKQKAGNLEEEVGGGTAVGGGRTSKAKQRMPKSQAPDGTVARSPKRRASRFYQVKAGHCHCVQYLNRTKNWPTPKCW